MLTYVDMNINTVVSSKKYKLLMLCFFFFFIKKAAEEKRTSPCTFRCNVRQPTVAEHNISEAFDHRAIT